METPAQRGSRGGGESEDEEREGDLRDIGPHGGYHLPQPQKQVVAVPPQGDRVRGGLLG